MQKPKQTLKKKEEEKKEEENKTKQKTKLIYMFSNDMKI